MSDDDETTETMTETAGGRPGPARTDGELAEALAENARLTELLNAPPYVDCICPGCPRKVPHAWASGLCQPCATEDCDHTDGARATAEALAEEQARSEKLWDERNRLRAALADTAANRNIVLTAWKGDDLDRRAAAVLEALARAAGIGPP